MTAHAAGHPKYLVAGSEAHDPWPERLNGTGEVEAKNGRR
jgi:hypothetical protein